MAHDHWLEVVREEFRARHAKPLACKPATGEADLSWVGQLTYDHRMVRLDTPGVGNAIDLAARDLRDTILNMNQRFMLIIDETLKLRGMYKYSPDRTNISAFDRLACVDAYRSQPRRPHNRPVAAQTLRVA